ncbi:pollen-specific leucine-rich repeat extensin-like protein 1 [Haliotis rufescens]|uniref:pollen-specific leucine-rich repeat extensin-like protein 1 n=1 Tax=Haliotis rufescens TaxID=6454 RepID=UPI001EB06D7F|nr:pollen-specific leucine-rich repeat extensin-like protein 1 [Haliotis rufescens]XP_046373725.1 pollen-specific leucine-rich repeat extensin-like protein 1 [Haliotis rufescens]
MPLTRRSQDSDSVTPHQDAVEHCMTGVDKEDFTVRFISQYKGQGVFTTKHFQRGDFLLEYIGQTLSAVEGEERLTGPDVGSFLFFVNKNLCIHATDSRCYGKFVNDSMTKRRANALMKPLHLRDKTHLCLFAKRDISPNEEVTYYYGPTDEQMYWRLGKQPEQFYNAETPDRPPVKRPPISPVYTSIGTSGETPDRPPVERPPISPVHTSIGTSGETPDRPVERPQISPVHTSIGTSGETPDRPVERPPISPVHTSIGTSGETPDRPVERPPISPVHTSIGTSGETPDRPVERPTISPVHTSIGTSVETPDRPVERPPISPVHTSIGTTVETPDRPVERPPISPVHTSIGTSVETPDRPVERPPISPVHTSIGTSVETPDRPVERPPISPVHTSIGTSGETPDRPVERPPITPVHTSIGTTVETPDRPIERPPISPVHTSIGTSVCCSASLNLLQDAARPGLIDTQTSDMGEASPVVHTTIQPSLCCLEACSESSDSDVITRNIRKTIPLIQSASETCISNSMSEDDDLSDVFLLHAQPMPNSKQEVCVSIADSTTDTKVNSNPKQCVTVSKSTNTSTKRVWDKVSACVYCQRVYAKLPQHMEQKHKDEIEIAAILSFPPKSAERKLKWQNIRNRGNFHHNTDVLVSGQGSIIPLKRPPADSNVSAWDYLPCENCFAFLHKKDLWRHANTKLIKVEKGLLDDGIKQQVVHCCPFR